MPEALVILNPASGRGRGAGLRTRLPESAAELNLSVCIRESRGPGHEIELATQAASEGWPVVVAAGGDGTVHGVANGLLSAGRQNTSLGLIPVGTGNDYARLLGIKSVLSQALRSVAGGVTRTFDVGKVGSEYFVNGLGVGFGPAVLREMHDISRLRGSALYFRAAWKAFGDFLPSDLQVEVDGTVVHEAPALMAEAAIGTSAGGGFQIAPAADPEDGLIDLCMIDPVNHMEFVRYLPAVLRGKHMGLPPVSMHRGREIVIRTPRSVAYHLDGELRSSDGGELKIEVRRAWLPVICAA